MGKTAPEKPESSEPAKPKISPDTLSTEPETPQERTDLGEEIGEALLNTSPETSHAVGLIYEIPEALPVPAAHLSRFSFPEWHHIPHHPIFGDSAYPILDLPGIGRVRLTAGFMEYFGHGLKHDNYTVIMPDGHTAKVGPKTGKGSGRFNVGIDYVIYDPHKKVKAWYGGDVVATIKDGTGDTRYGNRVIVKTDVIYKFKGRDCPVYQAYGHLKSFSVKKGDHIKQGDNFAVMGATGGTHQEHVDLRTFIITKGTFEDTLRVPAQPGWIELSPNALENQLMEKDRLRSSDVLASKN